MKDDWYERQEALDPLRRELHRLEKRLVPFGFAEMRGFSTYHLQELQRIWRDCQRKEELLPLLRECCAADVRLTVGLFRADYPRTRFTGLEDIVRKFPGTQTEDEQHLAKVSAWVQSLQ